MKSEWLFTFDQFRFGGGNCGVGGMARLNL